MLSDVFDQHAPWKERRVKLPLQPEWISDDIQQQMKTRDNFLRQKDQSNHKLWRNKVVSMIRKAKMDYYINIINRSKNNSKDMWKYFRELDPKPKEPEWQHSFK